MDTPFVYDKFVTGKNFIGRRNDCTILWNLLSQGEHVTIYEPPKSGKMSVIQQTLFNMRIKGKQFMVGRFSLMNVRSIKAFLKGFGSAVIRTEASTPAEYAEIIETHLAGTHFIFDRKRYSESDEIISLNWEMDENDLLEMLRLPQKLAAAKSQSLYLILDEFQNIALTEDGDKIFKALEKVIGEMKQETGPGCTFIFCGSMVNAMKEIFEVKKYFYRQVERLSISMANEKDIIDHIVRGFLSGGKVIEKELLLGMCKLFRNNLWYINHFISICDSLSKGYIIESILLDALDSMISIHEPRFTAMVNNLTTFQLGLLKAILDGHKKFSGADVIEQYSLNSSANVKRLKDALCKKEIVTFNENDEPLILDPLFEYWVKKYFFEMQ